MTSRPKPPLAEALGLEPHPEGGWFKETFRSPVLFEPSGYDGPRSAATLIYFLLEPDDESRWHVVASDEIWLWHRGGPLLLSLAGNGEAPGRSPGAVVLGPKVEEGQVLQKIVPAGTWQSAKPASDREVLLSCMVAPGFDFADFRLI